MIHTPLTKAVTLKDHPVRRCPVERFAHREQDPGAELVQGLIFFHEVKIDIGGDIHELENLIQHLAMLGSNAYDHVDRILGLQFFHDRKKLDGFRPRSEQNKNPLRHPR